MKRSQDVTEAEFAVLNSLWDDGPSTTRQLAERLYAGRKGAAATVLKLLERLEAKQCVKRDAGGAVLLFVPAVQREDLIARRLDAVADELCAGSRTPLLLHLVDGEKLSAEDIEILKKLVSDLDADRPAES